MTYSENSSDSYRYDRLSRALHWGVAAGIIWVMVAGYGLHWIKDVQAHRLISNLNASIATCITFLMIVRYVWRFFRPFEIINHHKNQRLVTMIHDIFYQVIFVVLISGFLMMKGPFYFFGVFHIPAIINNPTVNVFFFNVHRYSCMALGTMLLLHVLAVIKHHIINKRKVLLRML
ncbi:cytochrome B [Enterobacter sp. JMULE2]|uniref:cytochrome b n=1 Tax=Enterobacter sp. JMULE2 TaxID=2518340 RepID=UPI0015753F77|nr:cytochrome b/b6 domain-containing protein [Enterobacter sp. JMULE2]NTZ39799.1 cytochrome B [Enterobacter sp. JMULE2]